jgi:ferredoxin
VFPRLDQLLARAIRPELNPFIHAGGIANTALLVACATGIVLLVWYRTSVHTAYASVVAIDAAVLPHFLRSLHRYSSDVALLFALIHAAREATAGKLGRVRWLAWTTGLVVVFALWLVGFLGYWLVWDARGHALALGSARVLDRFPIFSEPLLRSFLADELLSSLLFFVVFFLHMLIPLAMGIGLWLHITRLSRPAFLTRGWMTVALIASMAVLSLVAPADLAAPAHMSKIPSGFAVDAWFLWPLLLGEQLGAGAAGALVLFATVALFSAPWLLSRARPRPAVVEPSRCTACERCYADCPYDAIRMVPRSDGRPYPSVALVDPSRCVGCGICAGSCDSAGIGLDWFDSLRERRALDERLAEALTRGPAPKVAFVCAEATASPAALAAAASGYEVMSVPCAGWVHPLLAERGLRRGASEVTVVGCPPGQCHYREGSTWTHARLSGRREPALRTERTGDAVRSLDLYRHESASLPRALAAASSSKARAPHAPGRFVAGAAGLVLAVTLSGIAWGGTRLWYRAQDCEPALVVSLKAAGATKNACRPLTAEERKGLPIHMQGQTVCERGRADVRLRISIDGRMVLRKSYAPRVVWGYGNSVAIERLRVPAGDHRVRVEVGDGLDTGAFVYVAERTARFESARQTSVLFDQSRTFRWY